MRRFLGVFTVFLALITSCSPSSQKTPQPHEIIEGKASYVIDGNTFYFTSDYGKDKVRLYNIDTPAMKDKNGFEAYEFLRGLIHQKSVFVEYIQMDSEGRWLVNANLASGENIQEEVLKRFPPPKIIRKPNPTPIQQSTH